MIRILNIETSTEVCSSSLSVDGKTIAHREDFNGQSHSTKLALQIQALFEEVDFTMQDLDAVAVSKGPGSYTGLRIGVSTAKGICYGSNKPLIAINTLQVIAAGVENTDADILCPMIDARRMEVYASLFDKNLAVIKETEALIIDEQSFLAELQNYKVAFMGNGASKCKDVIKNENAIYIDGIHPLASYMSGLSYESFKNGAFEDVAYFEPFYLKDFVAIKSKNPLKKQLEMMKKS